MGSSQLVPGLGIGVQPFGNAAGSQNPGPSSILQGPKGLPASTIPGGGQILGTGTINPATQTPLLPAGVTGTTTATPVQSAIPGALPAPTPPTGASTIAGDASQGNLNKQLTDTYGKGVGSLLQSELGNIGSNNDAYMQAYEAAMAQPNAENLATLQTTLGNEGVSGNSSTSAIATADFQSGVVSAEGLQEQQLQENDVNQMLGLTESIEGQSAQEAQSSGWSEFGQVLGSIGGAAADALLI